MLYSEFLELSGLTENQVTVETYATVIEPMYHALPNLSKQQFVKLINGFELKQSFPNIERTLRKMRDVCTSCAREYSATKLRSSVISYRTELETLGVELSQLELHGETGMPEINMHYRGGEIYKIDIKIYGWANEKHTAIYQVSHYAYDTKAQKITRE